MTIPHFRIALVQFDIQFGDIEANKKKICQMLADQFPNDETSGVDLIVFPEMTLTGYVFQSRQEIQPFMESTNGTSIQFFKSIAQKYRCHVIGGFPFLQKRTEEEDFKCSCRHCTQFNFGRQFWPHLSSDRKVAKRDPDYLWLNAACLIDEQGTLKDITSKHFLFESDKPWADESLGFKQFKIKDFSIGIGICMDINHWEYDQSHLSFCEFATWNSEKNSDFVILLCNWLASQGKILNAIPSSTLKWWQRKSQPFFKSKKKLFICNRVGIERGSIFAGGSSRIDFSKGKEAEVVSLTDAEEKVLIVDL